MEGDSLTHSVLDSFLSMEFLLNIPCRFRFYVGSFSYTPHADFVFMQGVSSTHTVLASFSSGEFLLHIPCWFLLLSREFLLHIPCWLHFYLGSLSYTSRACFDFYAGVSLTDPVLASIFFFFFFFFLSGKFLLHIPCWLHFCLGSFSYTSRDYFFYFF